jgi:hypothetical protein
MTTSKIDREATRKARSQDSLTVQADVTVALVAGGLSLALTHEQQALAHAQNVNPAPQVTDPQMPQGVDAFARHAAQVTSDAATSLAVTGPVMDEHASVIEQSTAPLISTSMPAPADIGPASHASTVYDGEIVDHVHVDRPAHEASMAGQAAGSTDIGSEPAGSPLAFVDGMFDRALDMTSSVLQTVSSAVSAAVTTVAQVLGGVETLLGNQGQTIEQVADASTELVGHAAQSFHGFDALIGSQIEEVSGVAPALLGAGTSTLNEGAAAASLGEFAGVSELVPTQLGFLGQSYVDPHEPAGLLHGFV